MKRARSSLTGVDPHLLGELFDHAPDLAFFIKDDSGRYLVVNDSLVERHGLNGKQDMIGKRPGDVIPGDFGRIPTEQDAWVLRTGRPIIERLELHWFAPNKPVWCLTTKLPLLDAEGQISGIIGISKDVRSPIRTQEIPPDLAVALRELETNYAFPLTTSTLAKLAKLPVARFARLVKRIFSITPIQLIAKTRIAAASEMLRQSDRTISEIALECGYYDHSAFTRSFRTITSMTPTEYRNGTRNKQARTKKRSVY